MLWWCTSWSLSNYHQNSSTILHLFTFTLIAFHTVAKRCEKSNTPTTYRNTIHFCLDPLVPYSAFALWAGSWCRLLESNVVLLYPQRFIRFCSIRNNIKERHGIPCPFTSLHINRLRFLVSVAPHALKYFVLQGRYAQIAEMETIASETVRCSESFARCMSCGFSLLTEDEWAWKHTSWTDKIRNKTLVVHEHIDCSLMIRSTDVAIASVARPVPS